MRELAEARKAFSWFSEGSSSVQQAALRGLDRANILAGRTGPLWRVSGRRGTSQAKPVWAEHNDSETSATLRTSGMSYSFTGITQAYLWGGEQGLVSLIG